MLGELKASIADEFSLVTLLPLNNLLPKKRTTSGIKYGPATSSAPSTLSTESFLISEIGIYDPVSTTVLFRFSRIKLRTDAV